MGFGPIPWTAIIEWADRRGIEGETFDLFNAVIRRMDVGWMQWQEAEREKQRELDRMRSALSARRLKAGAAASQRKAGW